MDHQLNLSRNLGSIKSTSLEAWTPTFSELCRALFTPKIDPDKLNAGYFLRCAGTKRGNETVSDTASLLILDGDSRIDDNGEVVSGAVNPMQIHLVLNHLKTDHFIYTSHSNNVGLWKYRVLIPCEYTRQQLPILLDWIFARLHENDVMLAPVKENGSWSQGWFLSCVHPDRANLFKTWWRVGGKESHPIADFEFVPSECFWAERIVRESKKPVNESIPIRVPVTNLSANNPIEAFNANFSVHDILLRNGYKQQGKRYLHPNSASKIAGVRILDNGRVYSDSSDCLNDGKAHDPFDCYRLLECGGDMKTALNWNADLTKANRRAFYDDPNATKPQQNNSATAYATGVKSTPNERLRASQFANSTAVTV